MSQLKCLIVVVAAAMVIPAVGCSRSSPQPAGQPAAAPAAAPLAPTAAAPAPAAARPSAGASQPAGTPQPAGAPGAPPAAAPATVAAQPAVPPEAPKPRVFTLAAGTVIQVETASSLSTKTNKAGEPFSSRLVESIVDGDWVIAPKGAAVSGVIVSSDPGGRTKGVASLTIRMKTLALADGETAAIATSTYEMDANTTKKADAVKIAVGAGAGAVVGGIAGGKKGAGVGAAAGAGAGTAVVLATRGDPAIIPAGSIVSFKLTAPITVTKK